MSSDGIVRLTGEDAPAFRVIQPPTQGMVVELPQVGGLHHRYERRAAEDFSSCPGAYPYRCLRDKYRNSVNTAPIPSSQ
jgi:hypothetical protein